MAIGEPRLDLIIGQKSDRKFIGRTELEHITKYPVYSIAGCHSRSTYDITLSSVPNTSHVESIMIETNNFSCCPHLAIPISNHPVGKTLI